jgi:amino acid transporter
MLFCALRKLSLKIRIHLPCITFVADMKFTAGQIAFVIFFVVVFIGAQIYSYRKDKSTNRKYYSGSWKVLIALAAVMVSLYFIIRFAQKH